MYVYTFGVIIPFIANNSGPPKRVINILKGFYSSHLKSRNFDFEYKIYLNYFWKINWIINISV